ncbi:MAG: HDIG domain-containing protein [Clostridiales bacterium]|nr:HDIG domain-containing protein [Clostridiales bacterium]
MKLGNLKKGLDKKDNEIDISKASVHRYLGQKGLVILSTLLIVLLSFICQYPLIDIAKAGLLTIILTSAMIFYIRLYQQDILGKMYTKHIISMAYLASIILLFIPLKLGSNYWMLGGFVVAMILDSKLGLLFHFNLSFLSAIIMYIRLEELVYMLIIGLIMAILTPYIRNRSTVIYSSIILLSIHVALIFLVNNFIFEVSKKYNYITSLLSFALVIFVSFYLNRLYERYTSREEVPIAVSDISCTAKDYQYDSRTSLELLIDENNALLQEMRTHSDEIYSHSLKVADLSYKAAKAIGVDEMLAKAGGLYHEIGKIRGSNYIEEGLNLADDYGFPKELKDIIRQHNYKYEKPSSVEAAIVMLSDNIVTTIDYIEKVKDNRFTANKIIEHIFQLNMYKGIFDDSDLSIKDYKILKEFYQNTYKE